jgi:hypothetical protein
LYQMEIKIHFSFSSVNRWRTISSIKSFHFAGILISIMMMIDDNDGKS